MKHKTRDSALPRTRSPGALALQRPQHRQRVIPDKRRRAAERDDYLSDSDKVFLTTAAGGTEGDNHVQTQQPTLDTDGLDVECTTWRTGETHGLCRDVRCDDCPINFDNDDVGC